MNTSRRRLYVAWLLLSSFTLLAATGIYVYWPSSARDEATIYPFNLPLMFLPCLHYFPADGEVMPAWDFIQPVVIEVRANQVMTINGGRFKCCPFEACIHVHGNAAVFAPSPDWKLAR